MKRVFEIEWDGTTLNGEQIMDACFGYMKSWTPKSVTELDLDAIKRRARLEALQSLIRKHDQKFGRRNTPLRDLLLNEITEPYRRRRG
jgi:hypothetical protein